MDQHLILLGLKIFWWSQLFFFLRVDKYNFFLIIIYKKISQARVFLWPSRAERGIAFAYYHVSYVQRLSIHN